MLALGLESGAVWKKKSSSKDDGSPFRGEWSFRKEWKAFPLKKKDFLLEKEIPHQPRRISMLLVSLLNYIWIYQQFRLNISIDGCGEKGMERESFYASKSERATIMTKNDTWITWKGDVNPIEFRIVRSLQFHSSHHSNNVIYNFIR